MIATPLRVGLVGCGNVSRRYLDNVRDATALKVVACTDVDRVAAARVAEEFGLESYGSVDALLADGTVDIVLNLTVPAAHADVTRRALDAGAHVYTEKPLAVSPADAREIVAVARELGLRVGCAPDTFLGAGLSTVERLLAAGEIGVPVSANAFMMTPGPEHFHPAPEFLYLQGAGPLFDGGPYYVTALTSLLGPITRVAAMSTVGRAQREVLVGDRASTTFPVETATHVASLLSFASGAVGSLVTSFDVGATTTPRLEIHGTEGSIVAPAPNSWGGPVLVRRTGSDEFVDVDLGSGSPGFMGMGLIEFAQAIAAGRRPAAHGERGLHVVEVLDAIRRSADDGRFYDIPVGDADVEAGPERGRRP